MPLVSPNLADLDFASIERMLRARIPAVAPEWTDHNDSDPGIALIQLFAWLGEQVGYRLNQVPEKSYIEFLKLVGVRLAPAAAAQTLMTFLLTKPERADGVLVPAASRITAKGPASPPPVFETDTPLDVIPAQLAAIVTAHDGLLDINGPGETGPTAAGDDPKAYVAERLSIAWDGKTPKLKTMPVQPVPLFFKPSEFSHQTLYIALAFNQSRAAGFLGARATLGLQIDSDEQPEVDAQARCGAVPLEVVNAFAAGPLLVEYAYYRPPVPGVAKGTWDPLAVIADTTDGWNRSGTVRFDVPIAIGPVPAGEWADVEPGMAHPLVGALKTPVDDTPPAVPVSGWIRVRFGVAPRIAVRALGFNMVTASNLSSVQGERLGRGNGRPGQLFSLGSRNVAAGSLALAGRDAGGGTAVTEWREVADFDSSGPDDAVFVLDAEAGVVVFGDGSHGRPPQADEIVIAARYRHGGGLAGDVDTGAVSQPAGLPAALAGAVNVTPARGGRDAEKLTAAKARAPHAFRARGRAVTQADFADAALAAPGVRVARAEVVPLHRPYPEGHIAAGLEAPGVDFDAVTPGALTVIVVPDQPGAYPMPTTGELTAVAAHLETLRLLTTEVHVTTPQYVRLFDFQIVVRAAPGYGATALREAIGAALERRFHVLTGGREGSGYPFGQLLHHADLVAEVFRVPGVDRVEALSCLFDGQTPDNAERVLHWRRERQVALRLTNCPATEADLDRIYFAPDEVPFVDAASLVITTVDWP